MGIDDTQATAADETHRLITLWKQSEAAVESAEHTHRRAQSERDRARSALIKWLVPEGEAKDGDKFHVWCGDILYTITKFNASEYGITESERKKK